MFFKRTTISALVAAFAFSACAQEATETGRPGEARAKNGMVVTAEPLATRVGVDILEEGGNAVDAAVAVGFALAVAYPRAGNIGGGGFMTISLPDGSATTIDYREKAPLSATRDMYLDEEGEFLPEKSQEGVTSAGVPGAVAGLLLALERYGTMEIDDVLEPAIELAENGFVVSPAFARSLRYYHESFLKHESTKRAFTKDDEPYESGETFVQEELAATLEEIADEGRDGFYRGWVADSIVAQMERDGGYITLEDLARYEAVEREPIRFDYRGYEIISMPPPSSGGVALAEILNAMERIDLEWRDWGSARFAHHFIEVCNRVYADRARHLGDMDFYDVPIAWLTSEQYADTIVAGIGDAATPADSISHGEPYPLDESEETTHYSIYDSSGTAVSVTTTINDSYGSKTVVGGAGFFLNDEMDDFSAKPGEPNMFGLIGGEANAVAPEKRPLSSMTPTIVRKDGLPYLVVGSPGGGTIITVVAQTIMNVLDFGMPIREAIDAPRLHSQWLPEGFVCERFALSREALEELERRGHEFRGTRSLGLVEGILVDRERGVVFGASDRRGSGKAAGY